MAVKKSAKSSPPAPPRKPLTPEQKLLRKRVAVHSLGVMAFSAAVGGSFYASYRYVKNDIAKTAAPPTVVLVDRPAWMTDALADKIIDEVRPKQASSPFDDAVLARTATALGVNPWVKSVQQVQRTFGTKPGDTMEIRCDFRTPVAVVQSGDGYWYVDAEGVKLPDKFSGKEVTRLIEPTVGAAGFRLIQGVMTPPPQPGKKWIGDDLKAGLELLALLADKPYTKDIVKIDVSNFAGRINPNNAQLNCLTRFGTEIRWGQPVSTKAFFVEVRVEQKLSLLASNVQRTGRADMNLEWIDLRFDGGNGPDFTQATGQ